MQFHHLVHLYQQPETTSQANTLVQLLNMYTTLLQHRSGEPFGEMSSFFNIHQAFGKILVYVPYQFASQRVDRQFWIIHTKVFYI